MNLAQRVKHAREQIRPNTTKDYLKARIAEFNRTGRTIFSIQEEGQPPYQRPVTTVHQLIASLVQISRGSEDTYAMAINRSEGIGPFYIVGDSAHQFDAGGVKISAVINSESDDPDARIKQATTALAIDRMGKLSPALIAMFMDTLLVTGLKRGSFDEDFLINTAAHDLAIGELVHAKLIASGASRIEGFVKLFGACAFSPYPKATVERLLEHPIMQENLRFIVPDVMGVKTERAIFGLPDEIIRFGMEMWCSEYMRKKRYPTLDQLMTEKEVGEIKEGIFG